LKETPVIEKLESLVGKHLLTGVDQGQAPYTDEYGEKYEDAETISFTLDGVTYTAVEDPDDGYRSMMGDLIVSDRKLSNTFPPVEVEGVIVTEADETYAHGSAGLYVDQDCEHEFIEFRDVKNGKIVLAVGTKDADDYYPIFLAYFSPENMSLNE
jgi:hypothetical protein